MTDINALQVMRSIMHRRRIFEARAKFAERYRDRLEACAAAQRLLSLSARSLEE
jgi:hypothetical protein